MVYMSGRLKKLYLNGNMIESVPANITALPLLEAVNVANNRIQRLPFAWIEKWGTVSAEGVLATSNNNSNQSVVATGRCEVIVTVIGNPLVEERCNTSLSDVYAMEEDNN